MGILVGVGVEMTDKTMDYTKHSVLHSACRIEVASIEYAIFRAEHGMHCIGPHIPVGLN